MSEFFTAFRKRDQGEIKWLKKSWLINESLYAELQRLANEKYDATINDLVIASIDTLIKTEDIKVFASPNAWSVKRSFMIPADMFDKLHNLKEKYNISHTKLINIAINNAIEADKAND